MDRKILISLLVIVALVLALAILLPGGRHADSDPKLPWDIETLNDGSVQVFSLKLGHSPLREAQTLLLSEGEITLFRNTNGELVAEAFFKRATLSGLRADFVFALELGGLDESRLLTDGARVARLGDGTQKITPEPAAKLLLANAPIRHLTYAPSTDLDESLLARMFGPPSERIRESEEIEHWLYPEKGLDIAVNSKGKELFQYLNPSDFNKSIDTLKSVLQLR